MPSPDQERLNVISEALADLVRQQREFDRRLARIEAAIQLSVPQPPPKPEPVPEAPAMPPPHESVSQEPARTVPSEPERPQRLETRIGLTLFNRIGVISIVVGIGFFFKWAVDNNWIGPGARVALGVVAGVLAIALADLLSRRGQAVFAQGVTAAGISVVYLALYAAFDFYHLIPAGLAFLLMVLTTVMSGALSLRYDSAAIAGLGLFGGFLTPVLLSSGEDRPWFLFNYILLLDMGALALAQARKWRVLETLSAVGTILLYGGWLIQHSDDKFPDLFFALAFYALYASAGRLLPVFLTAQVLTSLVAVLVSWQDPVRYYMVAITLAAAALYIARLRQWPAAVSCGFASFWLWTGLYCSGSHGDRPLWLMFLGLTLGFFLFLGWRLIPRTRARAEDLMVLVVNGAAYFGISWELLHNDYSAWMGVFAVLVGVTYGVLAYQLWGRESAAIPEQPEVLLSLGAALTFLTIAVPIQLSEYRITMAWAIEAAALSWIGARLRFERLIYGSAAVFALVLIHLFAVDAWARSGGRLLTFLIAAVAFWAGAKWVLDPVFLRLPYYIAGHIVMLWALTRRVLDWAEHSTAAENVVSVQTISVSILWAVYAIVLVSLGVALRTAVNRIAGLILMGVVVLKLYIFDVWQLSRAYRTLAFVALGVLLLSTSFLYSRFRGLIESWWKDDQVR